MEAPYSHQVHLHNNFRIQENPSHIICTFIVAPFRPLWAKAAINARAFPCSHGKDKSIPHCAEMFSICLFTEASALNVFAALLEFNNSVKVSASSGGRAREPVFIRDAVNGP